MVLYASTLESLPMKLPSENPTKIPMKNLTVMPMQNPTVNIRISSTVDLSESPSPSPTVILMPLTTVVEQKHYAGLMREEKATVLTLGYADLELWDCWQNHYKWIELGMKYVQVRQWWKELWWDIYSWNKYEGPPATDGKD